MKLVRFGAAGAERPGLVNADGSIADLSGVIPDLSGSALSPESLKKLASGELSKSEALGHQEFILTYKHFEPIGPACLPAA